ncbi:MAG: ATP-binding cassette domain-containing protein [Crocosphaera sp.]
MELTEEQLQEIADILEQKLTKEAKTTIKIAFLGSNGAGKSSFVENILGKEKKIFDEENTDKTTETITSNPQNTFLSPELNKVLEKLSQETNQSTEEILRKAIALIRIAIISEKQGATIAVVKNGKIMTEIIGLSTSAE